MHSNGDTFEDIWAGKAVFLLPTFELKKHQETCFNICGRIGMGIIEDPEMGPCAPCWHTDCQYEKGRLALGTLGSDDNTVGFARALKGIKND